MQYRNDGNHEGFFTERQWASRGYLLNPDATGVQMWANRYRNPNPFTYYSDQEVHPASEHDLGAYWEPVKARRRLADQQRRKSRVLEHQRALAEIDCLTSRVSTLLAVMDESVEASVKAALESARTNMNRAREYMAEMAARFPIIPPVQASSTIVVDAETTGLSQQDDELLQLSIISGNGEVLYSSYFRPFSVDIWPDAQSVNHISPEMVAGAPSIYDEVPRIKGIISQAKEIIGYNTGFDLGFLEAVGVSAPEDAKIIDVMLDFAPIYGEYSEWFESYKWQKLVTCAAYYGYTWPDGAAHDSLADCKATLFCYQKMLANQKDPAPVELDP